MSELVQTLRSEYSVILLIGPGLEQVVDLQIIAQLAQGLICVFDAPASASSEARRSLAELHARDAPILGQVMLEGAR